MQRWLYRFLLTVSLVFFVLDLIALPFTEPGGASFYAAVFGIAVLAGFIALISWEFRRQMAALEA